jgi:hypothetical protein
MNARTAATLGLRLIGLWIALESFLSFVASIANPLSPFAQLPGVHRRFYNGGLTADYYLHDTYYVVRSFASPLAGSFLGFILGILLMLFSRRLSRLFTRNLEDIAGGSETGAK